MDPLTKQILKETFFLSPIQGQHGRIWAARFFTLVFLIQVVRIVIDVVRLF